MRKTLSKTLFAFRFAFQNIIHSKFRSILLLLSFIALFVIVLLGFSTKPIVQQYYYSNTENKYRSIDVVMGIGPNSTRRFLSIQPLMNAEFDEEFIDDYMPFFEIQTLIASNEDQTYVNARLGQLSDFEKVIGDSTLNIENMANDEVILTTSLANHMHVSLGDSISIQVGETLKSFEVVDIMQEDGLFTGKTIFINKTENLGFFFTVLVPELAGLNPIFYKNLYNRIYFVMEEGYDLEEAIAQIQQIGNDTYADYEFHVAINYEWLDQLVNRAVSVFYVVIIFMFLAVFLVMSTTFLLLFQDRRKSFAVVSLLGGKWGFSFAVLLLEVLVFFGLSSVLSVVITNQVIAIGLTMLDSTQEYMIQNQHIHYSSWIVGTLFMLSSVYYYWKYYQKTAIEQTKEAYETSRIFTPWLIVVLSSVIVVYFLVGIGLDSWLPIGTTGLIQGILSIVLLFLLAFSLVFIVQKIIKRYANSTVFGLQFKGLLDRKAFTQFLSVVLMSFISVILLVGTNVHMNQKINKVQEDYRIDYILSNFVSDSRLLQTYDTIQLSEHVETADKVLLYRNVEFVEEDFSAQFFISMDPENIPQYFDFDFMEGDLQNLKSHSSSAVILPTRMQVIFGIEVGDEVEIYINPSKPNESFKVVGFVDNLFSNIIFTNYHLVEDNFTNAILVKSLSDSGITRNELIQEYSKHMIILFDFQESLENSITEVRQTTDFVVYIILVLLGCFVLALFNHIIILFEEMRDHYARMMVLGCSNWKMIGVLSIEKVILWIIAVVSSIVCAALIGRQLTKIILFFGEYELIGLEMVSIAIGLGIASVIYLVASVFYGLRTIQIRAADVLKLHE